MSNNKMSIEKAEYERFCAHYRLGRYVAQRFGQAFYNHFDLVKVNDRSIFRDLYQLDGDEAKALIDELFEMT